MEESEGETQKDRETARDGFNVRRDKCQRWHGGGVVVTGGGKRRGRRAEGGVCEEKRGVCGTKTIIEEEKEGRR